MDFSKSIFFIFVLISVSQTQRFRYVPRMVFFDLDFTLWPYYVDSTAIPPFHIDNTTGQVMDAEGAIIKGYPEVPDVLKYLHTHLIPISIISSSIAVYESKQLLDLMGWNKYFKYIEIYPISKDIHLTKIAKRENIPLKDVILFDDEPHVHERMEKIQVLYTPVLNGMSMEVLREGLQNFSDIRAELLRPKKKSV